jgi:hypothetical protein
VDPVPDPRLLRKSGSAGNRTRASGFVAWKMKRKSAIGIIIFILFAIEINRNLYRNCIVSKVSTNQFWMDLRKEFPLLAGKATASIFIDKFVI